MKTGSRNDEGGSMTDDRKARLRQRLAAEDEQGADPSFDPNRQRPQKQGESIVRGG